MNSRPHLSIMFTADKDFSIKMPGYFHVPMKFKVESLEKFIDDNFIEHSTATAKFIEEYKWFEEIEKEVVKLLSIHHLEFH